MLDGPKSGARPVDVDDACRVCVIGHGARLSGLVRRAAWCVARAGGGKRSAKNAAQVLRAHLGGAPGVIVRELAASPMKMKGRNRMSLTKH